MLTSLTAKPCLVSWVVTRLNRRTGAGAVYRLTSPYSFSFSPSSVLIDAEVDLLLLLLLRL